MNDLPEYDYNDLLEDKYVDTDDDLEGAYIAVNHYGFVWFKNPHYMVDDDEQEYILRKPTPKERREIVINTVIECNGRTFAIPKLARRLGVSDRTIQSILRSLQKEGLIEIVPRRDKTGKQKANAYRYIGPPCEKYGSGLTLQLLFSTEHDVGFRDWAWKECGFTHDKAWHSMYPWCQVKFGARMARKKYLLENNLPLIVPEDIKYLVLRYCHWIGKNEALYEVIYNIDEEDKEYRFSKDGIVRLPLEPLGRTERVEILGRTLQIDFGGKKENPEVTVTFESNRNNTVVFTWFDENIISYNHEIDEDHKTINIAALIAVNGAILCLRFFLRPSVFVT